VEKLIKEQFGVLMYADGKGQVVNRAEYLRWKFRGQEQVMFIKHECSRLNSPLFTIKCILLQFHLHLHVLIFNR
jgi:hypothetical protein